MIGAGNDAISDEDVRRWKKKPVNPRFLGMFYQQHELPQ
jgi:hypothetical protein